MPAGVWWDGSGEGDLLASVSLDLASAGVLFPVNSIPAGDVYLPVLGPWGGSFKSCRPAGTNDAR
jgi:hypothetical protein